MSQDEEGIVWDVVQFQSLGPLRVGMSRGDCEQVLGRELTTRDQKNWFDRDTLTSFNFGEFDCLAYVGDRDALPSG